MENDKNLVDIRNYMNYEHIKQLLITCPIESSLFELICILINNKLNHIM